MHRIQPPEQVQALVEAARALKFDSINVDLIYGLPQQTPVNFRRTIEQVCALPGTASRCTATRTCRRSVSSHSAASWPICRPPPGDS